MAHYLLLLRDIIIGLILGDASIIFAHPTFVLRCNSYEKTGFGEFFLGLF